MNFYTLMAMDLSKKYISLTHENAGEMWEEFNSQRTPIIFSKGLNWLLRLKEKLHFKKLIKYKDNQQWSTWVGLT